MSYKEKLANWAIEERGHGLIDVKFFPGTSNDSSIEAAARSVFEAMTGSDWLDITSSPL